MTKNGPCPCGSGRRAKRCCGVNWPDAAGAQQMALLKRAARQRSGAITHRCEDCQTELSLQMLLIPEHHPRCRLVLPHPLPDVLVSLQDAMCTADGDAIADALVPAVKLMDTAAVRFSLGQAVIALEEQGGCSAELCAMALDDLTASHNSALIMTALCTTLSEDAGLPLAMTA